MGLGPSFISPTPFAGPALSLAAETVPVMGCPLGRASALSFQLERVAEALGRPPCAPETMR